MIAKITKFCQRALEARKLGITFYGMARTKLPFTVRLSGKNKTISYSTSSDHLSDIVNICLDDEYGLKSMTSKPSVIVDVGGNIGLFSLWARHLFPKASIHVYEPNERVYPLLEHNVAASNIETYKNAVSSIDGCGELVDEGDSRLASAKIAPSGEIEFVSLKSVILDVGGKIDLLKLDCEGGEWEIFNDRESFKQVDRVRMEYHLTEGRSLHDLDIAVKQIGFEIQNLVKNDGFGIAWLERR